MNQENQQFESLRKRSEEILATQHEKIEKIDPAKIKSLIREFQVYKIELELQNEELMKAQEDLQKTHQKYLELFHNAPVGYVVLDKNGLVIECNDTFFSMLKLNSNLKGVPFNDFIHEEDKKIFLARYKAFFKDPGGKHIEIRMNNIDNDYFWAGLEAVPHINSNQEGKEQKKLLLIVSDITIRKKAEHESNKQKEKLEKYLDNAPNAIIIINKDGKILDANNSAKLIAGLTKEELVGMSFHDFLDNEYPNNFNEILRDIIISGKGAGQCSILLHDGNHRFWYIDAVKFSENEILCYVKDVTAKKKTDEELQKLAKLESLGILAGGIAHNFKNILTAMSLSVELISRNPNRLERHLDKIHSGIKQATALATKFQTFTKFDAPIFAAVKINEILTEAADMAITGSASRIIYDLDNDLPTIQADSKQLHEIFLNLIMNADQSMPKGGFIHLSTCKSVVTNNQISGVKPGKYIRISITDEGCGIPKAIQDEIFTPFFTTKIDGNGLGLSSVFYIIDKHKGKVEVDSDVNGGSTFSVYLPVGENVIQNEDKEEPPVNEIDEKIKVLLIEDDIQIQNNILEFSEFYDEIELSSSGDPNKAVQLYKESLKNSAFDIVILDLTFDGYNMDGLDILNKLKNINPDVKAIVFSGHSERPVVSQYAEYGFSGRLDKPLNLDEFISVIVRIHQK